MAMLSQPPDYQLEYDLDDALAIEAMLKHADHEIRRGQRAGSQEPPHRRHHTPSVDPPVSEAPTSSTTAAAAAAAATADGGDVKARHKAELEALMRQQENELRKAAAAAAAEEAAAAATPPAAAAATTTTTTPAAEDDGQKRLAGFWRNKYNALKAAQGELPSLRRRLKDYSDLHELDAYKLHRLCAELREREKITALREANAQKQLRDAKRRLDEKESALAQAEAAAATAAAAAAAAAGGGGSSSLTGAPGSPGDGASGEHARRVEELVRENGKLRYDLNVRCKVMWQLGEGQKELEQAADGHGAEVARLREAAELHAQSRAEEERLIRCLGREVEAAGEEADLLRRAVGARDEQVTLLLALVADRDATIDTLRTEAEALMSFHIEEGGGGSGAGGSAAARAAGAAAAPSPTAAFSLDNTHTSAQYTELALGVARQKTELADRYAAEAAAKKRDAADAEAAAEERAAALAAEVAALQAELRGVRAKARAAEGEGGGGGACCEGLREEVGRLRMEDKRLRHYISTLGARLDTMSGQLEEQKAKALQCEVGVHPPPYSPNPSGTVAAAAAAASAAASLRTALSPSAAPSRGSVSPNKRY